MNARMFKRLIWKEYRTQRALWLSLLLMALALPLLFQIFGSEVRETISLAGLLALGMPVLYALGCGAVLFAGEREEGTSEMLRSLPTSPGCLLAAKLAFGLASMALMFAMLFAYGWALWVQAGSPLMFIWVRPRGPLMPIQGIGLFWIVSTPQLFLLGALVSLLTRKVLTAVVVSGLLFALIAQLVERTREPLFVHLAVCSLVLAAQYGLVRRWLVDSGSGLVRVSAGRRRRALLGWLPTRHALLEWFGYESSLARLIWQEWRHALVLTGPYAALATLAVVVSAIPHGIEADLAVLLVPVTPLLFGVWTFRGEQHKKRFRFAAERGISPHRLWLSKHFVWLPLAAAATCLLYLFDRFATAFLLGTQELDLLARVNGLYRLYGEQGVVPFFGNAGISLPLQFVLYAAMAYAVGQFASMLIPRAVTAALVASMITGVLASWSILMDWLNVPLVWSVAPVPLVLLLATFVRTGGWMLERHRWQDWSALAAVLFVPGGLLVAGVAYYRVHEIPATGPGFDVAQFVRPVTAEEQRTAQMYRRAAELMSNASRLDRIGVSISNSPGMPRYWVPDDWEAFTPAEKHWLEDHQDALELALEATARPGCVLRNPKQARFDDPLLPASDLARLILYSAKQLEAENKLDESFDRYLAVLRLERHATTLGSSGQWLAGIHLFRLNQISSWIVHPEQTPERLRAAIRRLEQKAAELPKVSEAIKVDYVIARRIYETEWREQLVEDHKEHAARRFTLQMLGTCFPWERTRAFRLHNAITSQALQLVTAAESAPKDRRLAIWWEAARQTIMWDFRYKDRLVKWRQTTPLAINRGGIGVRMQVQQIDYVAELRAIRLIMALAAWRLEHGELPERLDDLVGPYFDELPRDPWSGQNFEYRPNGFPSEVPFKNGPLPANRPLLTSIGNWGVRVVVEQNSPTAPEKTERVVMYRGRAQTDYGGLGYPIP